MDGLIPGECHGIVVIIIAWGLGWQFKSHPQIFHHLLELTYKLIILHNHELIPR